MSVKLMELEELDTATLDKASHEAGLMARLDHPNLLRVFRAERAERGAYLVPIADGWGAP